MVQTLERAEQPAENVTTSSETEKVETPSEEKKPTLTKTYTEEEFRKAQSSWDKQISLHQIEAKKAKAEVGQFKAQLEQTQSFVNSLKQEMETLASDDPDIKKGYTDRIKHMERELKLAEREAKVDQMNREFEAESHNLKMAIKAKKLIEQTGIPLEQLEGCQDETELELKALRFQLANKTEPQEEERPKKFDSALPSGGGGKLTAVMVTKMSPDERFARRVEIANLPWI